MLQITRSTVRISSSLNQNCVFIQHAIVHSLHLVNQSFTLMQNGLF